MESKIKGFSLFDTLMALVLWSVFALVLFQQQLRQRVFFQRIVTQTHLLQLQQNDDEMNWASLSSSQRGLSLLGCLCSLALASLLLIVSLQHYLRSQFLFHQQQIKMTQTMDLQWIENLLRHQIRQAGFTPCLNIDDLKTWHHLKNQPIGAAVEVSYHPEKLHLRQMSAHYGVIKAIVNPYTLLVSIIPHAAQTGDMVLIADCEHAEVVQIHDHSSPGRLQLTTPLRFSYTLPAYWGKWEAHQWLVDRNAQGQSVFFHRLGRQREQLSSAVSAWRIEWLRARRLVKIFLTHERQESFFITHVRT